MYDYDAGNPKAVLSDSRGGMGERWEGGSRGHGLMYTQC